MHKSILNAVLAQSCSNPAFTHDGKLPDGTKPEKLPEGFTQENFNIYTLELCCNEVAVVAAVKPERGPDNEARFEIIGFYQVSYATEYTTPYPPQIYKPIPLTD